MILPNIFPLPFIVVFCSFCCAVHFNFNYSTLVNSGCFCTKFVTDIYGYQIMYPIDFMSSPDFFSGATMRVNLWLSLKGLNNY